MKLPEIHFGQCVYVEIEGENTVVHSYNKVEKQDVAVYLQSLESAGSILIESYCMGDTEVRVLKSGNDMILLVYYPIVKEMRIVYEPDSSYLRFRDTPRQDCCATLLTHIDLEDYGLSYVIRLSDGRFLIFDGGWEFEPDADKLMNCLREQTPSGKPVIAVWILTHMHLDHFRCCLAFLRKYGDCVQVERFLYNFPDPDEQDVQRIPALLKDENLEKVRELNGLIAKTGATRYRGHTGQVYQIGNARMEILSSPDDVFETPLQNNMLNKTSLVIKMMIENQMILWCADVECKESRLGKRWRSYLKSDILQIPHHGFYGGEIYEYEWINPEVCLLPGDEDLYFKRINLYTDRNRYLIYDLDVKDYFMGGSGNFTLKLPYKPRPNGRKLLLDKAERCEREIGARSWYFANMKKEDCVFTFINSAAATNTVWIDLYFEDRSRNISNIKVELDGYGVNKVNLFDPSEADHDALFFNRSSLKALGVPEGAEFAVNLKATIPFVVQCGKAPAYYA